MRRPAATITSLVILLVVLSFVPSLAQPPADPVDLIYNPAPYQTLTTTKAGAGTGRVIGPGIDCGADCTQGLTTDSIVTLQAIPDPLSLFAGWSGGCTGLGNCVVTMSGAKNVQATFSLVTFQLTVSKTGTGSGTVSDTGINCGADCIENYPADSVITLFATPALGSLFAGWSGACSGVENCIVTMSSAQGVTATFNTSSAINAASCSNVDVQAAINTAGDGGIVQVPVGTCTWTATVSIPVDRSITLRGSGIGQTIIQTGLTGLSPAGRLLTVSTKSTGGELPSTYPGYTRITGFTFQDDPALNCPSGIDHAMISIGGNTRNYRFDNNHLKYSSAVSIPSGFGFCQGMLTNGPFGIAHNNTFENMRGNAAHAVITMLVNYLGVVDGDNSQGDSSWGHDSTMGTSGAMYYENNLFTTPFSTGANTVDYHDGWRGQRTVFRFNDVVKGGIFNHGTDSSGRQRSYRHVEYYENVHTAQPNNRVAGSFRGGTGIAFYNSVTNASGAANTSVYGTGTNRSSYGPAGTRGPGTTTDPKDIPFWGACGRRPVTSLTCSGLVATGLISGGVAGSLPTTATSTDGSGGRCVIEGAVESHFNTPTDGVKCTRSGTFGWTYPVTSCPNPGVEATGTITWRAPYDGNVDLDTGNRCVDQGGAGKSCFMTGGTSFLNTRCSTGAAFPVRNELEPIYAWNNRVNNAKVFLSHFGGGPATVRNRDAYDDIGTSTIPSSCVSGGACPTGVGMGDDLPITCTPSPASDAAGKGGVGFWKTNEGNWRKQNRDGTPYPQNNTSGRLYTCTATDTWVPWYGNGPKIVETGATPAGEPYEYPHPLRLLP